MDTDEKTPPVPELATRRLWLRRLKVEDAPDLHLAYGDADAMRFWDAPPSRDVAETRRRIEQSFEWDPTWQAAWAVLSGTTDQLVGMVNYHARNQRHRRLSVGWILLPRHWGLGYMQEAASARRSEEIAQQRDQRLVGRRHRIVGKLLRPYPGERLVLPRHRRALPAPAQIQRHQQVEPLIGM